MIHLRDVSKSFDGETFAVRQLNLEVDPQELIVVLGESGCGKTTTMKMINRLVELTSGQIEVDGENVQQLDPVMLRRQIGYVFQDIGLFPHMTVGSNVEVVPRLLKWPRERIDQKRDELLTMVKLSSEEYRQRLPRELSGGQRQRVGLARALAGEPKIMLMDEPFGALDPLNRDLLQQEYRRIHDELGLTTLMVTHDMTEALLMADRIAVMNHGEIIQLGPPEELVQHPADEYVERLIQTPKRQTQQLERLAGKGGQL